MGNAIDTLRGIARLRNALKEAKRQLEIDQSNPFIDWRPAQYEVDEIEAELQRVTTNYQRNETSI